MQASRRSYPGLVKSYQEIPSVFQDFFASFLSDGRDFPNAVLIPSYQGFNHRTTEKLVCELGIEIYVFERMENSFEAKCFTIDQISYVEVRAVLLDSLIKIIGMTKQGILTTPNIKFNTVPDYLFTPILERMRGVSASLTDKVQDSVLEKFDHWVRLNYKFMNYTRSSLLPGEKVVHTIL
jgi:hypothetical protein